MVHISGETKIPFNLRNLILESFFHDNNLFWKEYAGVRNLGKLETEWIEMLDVFERRWEGKN